MPAEKYKVFVLDRSKAFINVIRSQLDPEKYTVESEIFPDKALVKIIQWRPDLLITAIEVGNISGYDLCLILKMIPDLAGMPVILISAYSDDSAFRHAAKVGADYYVPKNRDILENIKAGIDKLLAGDTEPLPSIAKRPVNSVLVVDDSPMMRRVIMNMLYDIGIPHVFEAENGHHALKMLDAVEIDLVTADWGMPGMNGLEFVKTVRKNARFKNLGIALVTAEGVDTVQEGFKAGANDYLNKPFNAESMKKLIAKFASNITL